MSGHSKWASIKHKKAIVDSRKGKHFTKLARAITIAAREGGDPDGNPTLANAIQKAKDASMPKDNIERAVAKGTGEGADAEAIEAVVYEGYGPGGVAFLVETLTDNRNRTGSDVRHLFTKHGGNLGEPGSVAYLFDKRGVVVVTEPANLAPVRAALETAGINVESAEVVQRPQTLVTLDAERAPTLLRMVEALEDLDDVDAVHANFDVPAEVMEQAAS
jgi:transcriptional/translational regulatory protein YebC/TACO1